MGNVTITRISTVMRNNLCCVTKFSTLCYSPPSMISGYERDIAKCRDVKPPKVSEIFINFMQNPNDTELIGTYYCITSLDDADN